MFSFRHPFGLSSGGFYYFTSVAFGALTSLKFFHIEQGPEFSVAICSEDAVPRQGEVARKFQTSGSSWLSITRILNFHVSRLFLALPSIVISSNLKGITFEPVVVISRQSGANQG